MKKTGKRFISAFLAIIMVASLFITGVGCPGDDDPPPSTAVQIKTLDQINTFDKSVQLIYAQYTTLWHGSISAIQKGGRWFYRFTYAPGNGDPKTYQLDVLASAFNNTASTQNDPRVNKDLESAMKRNSNVYTKTEFFYKTSERVVDTQTYCTYIARMVVNAKRDGKKCTIMTKLGGELRLFFSEDNSKTHDKKFYEKALRREFSSQNGNTFTNPSLYYLPVIDFRINNTGYEQGKAVPLLSLYRYKAKGTDYRDRTVSKNYYDASVALTKALLFKDASSCIDLATTVISGLKKQNGEYFTKDFTLSEVNGSGKAIKASLGLYFKSPIALHVAGDANDYYMLDIELTNSPLNATEFDIYYNIHRP